jgi:hypothetical protein
MKLMEAVNAVVGYLSRQQIVFTLTRAWEVTEAHFRVSVHQYQPENTQRVFDVLPTDVADCWNVVEVAQ